MSAPPLENRPTRVTMSPPMPVQFPAPLPCLQNGLGTSSEELYWSLHHLLREQYFKDLWLVARHQQNLAPRVPAVHRQELLARVQYVKNVLGVLKVSRSSAKARQLDTSIGAYQSLARFKATIVDPMESAGLFARMHLKLSTKALAPRTPPRVGEKRPRIEFDD